MQSLELVAAPVAAAACEGALSGASVAEIDPTLSDTEAFCEAYDVDPAVCGNCVVVHGRRGENETDAAVVVLGTDRADVNRTVRKQLGVRKISFADQSATERTTGMTSGGITPVGLPAGWPILIDRRVVVCDAVVIGAGTRGAKLLVAGGELAEIHGADVLDLRVE
jgi:prolyl-tRNA editing enzyme YbaK/EbsC (Cys-tRNA(Pro) deacylase)